MDEDKQILYNYLLSINDKNSEVLSDVNNQKVNLIDDNIKKENINNDINSSNSNDNNNKYMEKNNRNENELNSQLDNEINNKTKKILIEDHSYRDFNKRRFNNKINLESKINKLKENNDDDDYNKCFKNRMDIMQAVLDDELNISSKNNNFTRRRAKSRTTVKINENKLKNIKLQNNYNDYNKFYEKENIKEQKEDNDIHKTNFENYIDNEKEEVKIEKKFNNIKNENELLNIKEDKSIKNKIIQLDYNKKNGDDEKENKLENLEKKIEENITMGKLSNILETSKKNEEKINNNVNNNTPKNKNININKISEEINFEIFNDKYINHRKGSYIDINFNNNKDINNTHKENTRIHSDRIKNKENSQFRNILNDYNKFNNNNNNKFKSNYNKSYINIKEYNNNNLIKSKDKRISAIPINNKYYNIINNNNYVIKNEESKNINNAKNKFPESLDNLINKIKDTYENKNNNNYKGIKKNNSNIGQKIKDIKDSLQKIKDINKENENLLKENNKFNTNIKPISFNNLYFSLLDESYQPINKNISRNFVTAKRTDSSDFIFYKKLNKDKIENNISFPSNLISKKTNSYSNIHTLNNSSSPIRSHFKNKKIFTINNININNLQLINKNLKIKNILEDFESNNLMNNINISDRTNSQGIIDDKKMKKKGLMNDMNNNIISQIRLYYSSEKMGNKHNSNNSLHKTNSSNFKSYKNKINSNNLIKDYTKLKECSKDKKDDCKINFVNKRINYKNDNLKTNNIHYYSLSSSSHNKNPKYIYDIPYKGIKCNIRKKNKIKQIPNYSKQSNENLINYKNYNIKDLLSPFDKLRRKKIHSIFPVNPFDNINYIKERNFLIN